MKNNFKTSIINSLELAIEALKNGHPVAVPTETVYGLAANATNDQAIRSIYEVKGRPSHNPLIVHVSSIHEALKWGEFNELAFGIAQQVWTNPEFLGGVTLVVPLTAYAKQTLSSHVMAGEESIALRVPRHNLFQQLLSLLDFPLAAPSANRSNYVSPTSAEHVHSDLHGLIPYVLDGGQCQYGLESTIIDVRSQIPLILRFGSASYEDLKKYFPNIEISPNEISKVVPGLSKKHYSPKAILNLDVLPEEHKNFYIGFGYVQCDINLSEQGSLEEAAFNLYDILRRLDDEGIKEVDVYPIPYTGLGRAINDRLKRAAAI